MLRRFAARHPGRITVIDLARRLCPQGPPCRPVVDGRQPRPDGAHFDAPGSVWAAHWVLAQLAHAAGAS
jgi:sugar lactone lactonase YvrE